MDRIGNCERCGIVDHHLIEGLCSGCDGLVMRHADPALDRDDYDGVPLGVEAGRCPVLAVDGEPQGINVDRISYMMPSLRRFIGGH
jgi:hypothetical protein